MKPHRTQHGFSALPLLILLSLPCNIVLALSGSGSADAPYQIASAKDLSDLSSNSTVWSSTPPSFFQMTADVDLEGAKLPPMGTFATPFTGSFDGAGHRIKNLVVYDDGTTPDGVGLFGVVDGATAILSGVILENPTITGNSAGDVGALVGRLQHGTVTQCAVVGGHVTGAVSTTSRVGGLVGTNFGGSLDECYSTALVESASYGGGLVGVNETGGWITDCYAAGRVILRAAGPYRGGGLVGSNQGSIWFCYANSPWNSLPLPGAGPGYLGGLFGETIRAAANPSLAALWSNFSNDLFGAAAGYTDVALPKASAAAVPLAALMEQLTFKHWDFDTVWYVRASETPRLRWQNHAPIADATMTPFVWNIDAAALTGKVTLDASKSQDNDGDPLTYRWTWPGGGTPATSIATTDVPLPAGTYTMTLWVNDGVVESAAPPITVTVNRRPVANAAAEIVQYDDGDGSENVTLTGSGSDLDGDPLSFKWTWFIAGSTTTKSGSTADGVFPVGTTPVTFTVDDGHAGGSASATVEVAVKPALPALLTAASPSTVGRTSSVPDVKFYVLLPTGKSVTDVDPKAPINLVQGKTTIPLTRDGTYAHKKCTVVAVATKAQIVGLGGGTVRVQVRLNTGEYVTAPVTLQVVDGFGTSPLAVAADRMSYYLDGDTWK